MQLDFFVIKCKELPRRIFLQRRFNYDKTVILFLEDTCILFTCKQINMSEIFDSNPE